MQLSLVFDDSPERGAESQPTQGAPCGRDYLLLTASSALPQRSPTTARRPSLEQVAQPDNLARALLAVARNKGAAGVDGRSVHEVVRQAHVLLPQLHRELRREEFEPGEIRRAYIPKPQGGRRALGIPNVLDRWVQQAVLQVLQPVLEPHFHDSSHGFRPQRGARTAIAEVKEHLHAGHHWVVSLDLSKFFDRVDHQRLMSRLGGHIEDIALRRLIFQMLKAQVVLPDGQRVRSEKGTPQGGPLSPLLSNLVLDELDRELERRGHRFVRYADDIVVYVRSKRAGQRVLESLGAYLEEKLRLSLNLAKSQVARSGEVSFLGVCVEQDDEGHMQVKPSASSLRRVTSRLKKMTPRNWGRPLLECIEELNVYLRGWFGYFGALSTKVALRAMNGLDARIRRRLRAIVICQRKRPRHLHRHLVERGVRWKQAANAAYRRCGPWKKSNLRGITQAYPNAWFHERLFTLKAALEQNQQLEEVSGQRLMFLPRDMDN